MEANIAQKPKTLSRTLNTALISWENVFTNVLEGSKYILQMENSFCEWKSIYWYKRGTKNQFLVESLAPCTCYNFRLKMCHEEGTSEWVHFKSGTDAEPYFVIHFTRAVKFGKTPIIRKIIIKRPILLETENKEGKTPLIQAIEGGNLQMVTFLMNLGANVNTATLVTKRTPLMVALFNSNLQISNLLLDKGANLLARDCNFLTGLHHAVDSGSLENVKLCLSHECDINAQDNKGWTPLLRAAEQLISGDIYLCNVEPATKTMTTRKKPGFTFLFEIRYLVYSIETFDPMILNCPDEIVGVLLNRGADSTIRDKNGFDFYKHIQLANRMNLEKLASKFTNNEEKKEKEEV